MIETRFESKDVDILLLAEGTYPFERGGVASWIYDIICQMPEIRFGIIFLGASEGMYEKYAYPIPSNVVHLQIIYLFSSNTENTPTCSLKHHPENLDRIRKIHEVLKNSHGCPKGLIESIEDINGAIAPDTGFDFNQFLRGIDSWDYIVEQYSQFSTDPSFINYFWNIRNMHEPLWALQAVMDHVPKANVIHTISTGYAGLLAVMLHQRYDFPLILSEHGIYTKERNIELLQSNMIINLDKLISSKKTFTYQHELWLKFFDSLARMCYHYADLIISLFASAQKLQVLGGADIRKSRIIPNGVNLEKFSAAQRPIDAPVPKIVCFVGRFVRIKDIKTFIRAVSIMLTKDSSIEAWIKMVGEGDPEYIEECNDYINLMDLTDKIKFVVEGDMVDILSKIGLLIVSSISEGMPLVVLESIAAGIPVVATDVGACREVVEGRDEEDKLLGTCGQIVSISDTSSMAEASVRFLNDTGAWKKASRIALKRSEKYYDQKNMIELYREIYHKAIIHGRDRI